MHKEATVDARAQILLPVYQSSIRHVMLEKKPELNNQVQHACRK